MADIARPRLEGSVAVRGERRLSFAEFGNPRGAPVFWLHGTPGGRRQVPVEARKYALENDLRIIGIDRPGIGTSTPHLYDDVLDWTGDLAVLADNLGVDTFRVIGLSGGGPYALAAGVALPERVHGIGVLGGVAPTQGVDAIRGGLVEIAPYAAPILGAVRLPLSYTLAAVIHAVKPLAGVAIGTYGVFQPRGDRELLARPEVKAMFLDDLINGARFQVGAPLADIILFTRYWGFDAADVTVPVRWWHGDDDHIIPHAHGVHMVERLPDAVFATIDGESHLSGMNVATDVLETLMELGPRKVARKGAAAVGPRP